MNHLRVIFRSYQGQCDNVRSRKIYCFWKVWIFVRFFFNSGPSGNSINSEPELNCSFEVVQSCEFGIHKICVLESKIFWKPLVKTFWKKRSQKLAPTDIRFDPSQLTSAFWHLGPSWALQLKYFYLKDWKLSTQSDQYLVFGFKTSEQSHVDFRISNRLNR